jgi:hypothetical protein
MPSPFPGMDPYLESSDWLSFHAQFVAELGRQLAPKLRPTYLALVGQREVLTISNHDDEEVEATLYADVAVARRPGGTRVGELSDEAGVAVAAPVRVRSLVGRPAPERFLEIRDTKGRRLIALIEVLSPTNKRGDGYLSYVDKRNHVFRSGVHLLEIDLHHLGRRVPTQDPLPPAPYYVFLSRGDERPMTHVWPVRLDEPLPIVPVPLEAPDLDAPIDLQAAFTAVYDAIGYQYVLDYAEPPPVELGDEAAAWIAMRLDAAGLPKGR